MIRGILALGLLFGAMPAPAVEPAQPLPIDAASGFHPRDSGGEGIG